MYRRIIEREISMITQWYGWVPYYYRLNIITKAGQTLDMQLSSNKIYLYPEQILRAWYKNERKRASREKNGIRGKQGIHYKKMNTYYFIPFDSIDHITMKSVHLESEEPPYKGVRAKIESLKRSICDVIPFCSKKTLMFTNKLEYQKCERNENENAPKQL